MCRNNRSSSSLGYDFTNFTIAGGKKATNKEPQSEHCLEGDTTKQDYNCIFIERNAKPFWNNFKNRECDDQPNALCQNYIGCLCLQNVGSILYGRHVRTFDGTLFSLNVCKVYNNLKSVI